MTEKCRCPIHGNVLKVILDDDLTTMHVHCDGCIKEFNATNWQSRFYQSCDPEIDKARYDRWAANAMEAYAFTAKKHIIKEYTPRIWGAIWDDERECMICPPEMSLDEAFEIAMKRRAGKWEEEE